jgi:hypothetical protein
MDLFGVKEKKDFLYSVGDRVKVRFYSTWLTATVVWREGYEPQVWHTPSGDIHSFTLPRYRLKFDSDKVRYYTLSNHNFSTVHEAGIKPV